MHLVVCATARKLPLPPRLPRCLLRLPPSSAEQPPSSAGQPQQEKKLAVPESAAAGKKKKKATKKQKGEQPPAPETSTKDETAPRVDLKRATKEFKNGATKAEDFLPVLEVSPLAWHLELHLCPARQERLALRCRMLRVMGFKGHVCVTVPCAVICAFSQSRPLCQ